MVSPTKLTIMSFPQRWSNGKLKANILVLPHENPLTPFAVNVPAGSTAPAFADASLHLNAMIIDSLAMTPRPSDVTHTVALNTTAPTNSRLLFQQLEASFNITKPSNVVTPASSSTYIQKYLPNSYRNSFAFSAPRTPYAKLDDSYLCAYKKKDETLPPPVYSDGSVSWGKVFAMALRQPVLARKLGFIYEVEIDVPAGVYTDGGWLFFDLQSTSDFYAQKIAQPSIIKQYAARIPALSSERHLFAAVQFPVSDAPIAGNYDEIFIEAEEYDDGFAKVVHCMQPISSNVLLEPGQEDEGLPPTKDFGIRLGWDDEQLLIWQNRQMTVDPDVGDRLDAPMGVFNYRVDVRKNGDDDTKWNSLNKVNGQLSLRGINLGTFNGELGIEVGPVQLDGQKQGVFWLPSYYTQWAGSSLVLKDVKAATLGGTDGALKNMMQAVEPDKVPLRYGETYDFRVRLADTTGGGPVESEIPVNNGPAPATTCRFRRLVPPSKVRIPDMLIGPPLTATKTSCQIFRPLLGYPSLVYTGLANAYDLLVADVPASQTEKREPAYFDPDVTMLQIDVEIKAPAMDNALSLDGKEGYYHLFTTTRNFPADVTQPITLEVAFHDVRVVKYGDSADFGDLPMVTTTGPLPLPTSRDIRIRVTAVCKEDNTLAYFGSEATRIGKPVTIYARSESADERQLFLNPGSPKEFRAIMLQPDPAPSTNLDSQMTLAGAGEEQLPNLFQRLADALELDMSGSTLFGKPGQRIVFGCSKHLRHTLSPEHGSITFGSKADLIHQWITVIVLDIKRDWAWDGLTHTSFEIKRDNTEVTGTLELQQTISISAITDADRSYTRLIFFDAVDPKDFSGSFPTPQQINYTVTPSFKNTACSKDADTSVSVTVPVAIPPAQVPKIASAGIALSPYEKEDDYSATSERRKVLWIEFEEPIQNPDDDYFAFAMAYAPDPILIPGQNPIEDPKDHQPYVPAELIRVITPHQSDDRAGLNAWQRLIPCTEMSPRHFIVPLPPGLNPSSKELFGFFTYEFCVGHARVWSTAQGRYGRPIKVTGIQHPAPTISCTTNRTQSDLVMTADFASPVFEGRTLMQRNPQTELWGVLYTQVSQADGKEKRNILLTRRQMHQLQKDHYHNKNASIELSATCTWSTEEIEAILTEYGIAKDSPLSVLAIELYKNYERVSDPLSENLGKMRIYRTSRLVHVPDVCCAC